jgi:hypothetical protein
MRVYGYEVRPDDWLERDDDDDDERGPLQLREATLFCTENDLRRVHRFISEVLTEADEKRLFELEDWHEHFRDRDPEWTKDEGDLIIAFDLTSKPPG